MESDPAKHGEPGLSRQGAEGLVKKPPRTIVLLALVILLLPSFSPHTHAANAPGTSYQSAGPSVPLFLQRVSDSSFEAGLGPWTQIFYNNYTGSTAQIVSPGYNDNSAAQLTINSGNLTIDSHLTL